MPTLTDKHVLVAYVDGSDLQVVAPLIRGRFQQFIANRKWATQQVLFIDQIHQPDPQFPDCLPDWDLGLNLGLDHIPIAESWFSDIESLVAFLAEVHEESSRVFVLFFAHRSNPLLQEHVVFVGGMPVDLVWLRAAISRLAGLTRD